MFPLGGAKWVIIQAILLFPEWKQFNYTILSINMHSSLQKLALSLITNPSCTKHLDTCQNHHTQKVQTKWRIEENLTKYACWITLTYWSITMVSKSLQVILFYCIHIPTSKAWLLRLDLLACIQPNTIWPETYQGHRFWIPEFNIRYSFESPCLVTCDQSNIPNLQHKHITCYKKST